MNKIEENWETIKETIHREYDINITAYNTWIAPLKYYKLTGKTVTVLVETENKSILSYIIKKYKEFFIVTISELMNEEYDVEFITDIKDAVNEDNINNKNNFTNSVFYSQSNLSEKYTFDNFVVGSNNAFAHSACLSVAESPGESFNPLFIYGGSGLGKTHLMQAIGNYVLNNNLNTKVLYVNSEEFTNEVIESIRSGNAASMTKLRDKYRTVDILLIDDIQFIIGKESTQEEFFHTFNSLYEAGKTIVISSDKHPNQMEALDERFRSRFQMGLQADIQPPNYETRAAILKKLSDANNKQLENEIIDYIATNINQNIRELEGAFNKILAYSKITKNNITLDLVKEALKDMIYPNKPREISAQIIFQVVAEHYGIRVEDITSTKRNQEIVFPRQIVMYLCRELLKDNSYENIAKMLYKKDHTTIMHGVDKIADQIDRDPEFAANIDIIKKKISPN